MGTDYTANSGVLATLEQMKTLINKDNYLEVIQSIKEEVDVLTEFLKEHKLDFVTTSYEVYKNRTQSTFELLDSIQGENIYRVYPHRLFCDTIIKDRCATHDDKNIFYSDDDHPSLQGAEMINNLIMKEIEKIELKSN